GAVRTVNDSALLLKSLEAYRALANDVMAKAREFGAPIPEGGIPPAQSKKLASGTAYFWPIPAMGQDEQIVPNLGIGTNIVAQSLSLKHTERLLAPTPLATQNGLLEPNRPLLGAVVLDIAGWNGVVQAWAEKFLVPALLAKVPDNAPPGLTRKEIPDQIATIFRVVQCIRG